MATNNPLTGIHALAKRSSALLETVIVTGARDKIATIARLKLARSKLSEAAVSLDLVIKEIERIEIEQTN